VENSHGILKDCFQQSVVQLAQAFDPSVQGTDIFPDFTARLESSTNQPVDTTHFGAALYDEAPDGKRLRVSFGMFNACLYKSYQFCTPLTNTDMRYQLPFLPTEYVVEAGHRLVLTFGPAASAFSLTKPVKVFVSTGQQDATRLVLPSFGDPKDEVAPVSVFGFDAFR